MSNLEDGRRVGRLIETLVPDLPSPPDRVAEVGRRVRRQRAGLGALVAAGVAVALTIPIGVALSRGHGTPEPAGPVVGCPSRAPDFGRGNGGLPRSAPGALAPPGAVRAVFCVYHENELYGIGPDAGPLNTLPPDVTFPRALVLTQRVGELVDKLNRIPAQEGNDACAVLSEGGVVTLEYRGGRRETIELSRSCNYVRRGDITRYGAQDASSMFDQLYLAQELATAKPDKLAAADCAPRLTRGQSRVNLNPAPLLGQWVPSVGPAAVVTACRYLRDSHQSLTLHRQVTDRATAVAADTAVEQAFAAGHPAPNFGCPNGLGLPGTVDALILRDLVGQTREVRVLRDTCDEMTTGRDSTVRAARVLDAVDALLGPPS